MSNRLTNLPSDVILNIAARLRPLELIRLKATQKAILWNLIQNTPSFLMTYNTVDNSDELFVFAHTANFDNSRHQLIGFRVDDGARVNVDISAVIGGLINREHELTLICAKKSHFLFAITYCGSLELEKGSYLKLLLVDISGRGNAVSIDCESPLSRHAFTHCRSNTKLEISEVDGSLCTHGMHYGYGYGNVRCYAIWRSSNGWSIQVPTSAHK